MDNKLTDEVIKINLEFISKEIAEIKQKLEVNYATKADIALFKAEFLPIKVIVYSVTSVAGSAAVVALLRTILK